MAFNLKHLSPLKEDYSLPQQGVNNVSYESDSPNLVPNTETVPITDGQPIQRDMLSQGTGDDNMWQKFKTAISNPLDAFKVAGGFGQDQFKGEGHTYRSMTSLRNAKDAQAKGVKVPDLEKSNIMNNVLSLAPPMILAQTISDAASGDLTALATKKLNKIPGIKKYVNAKNAKKLYYGMKGFKGLAKGL